MQERLRNGVFLHRADWLDVLQVTKRLLNECCNKQTRLVDGLFLAGSDTYVETIMKQLIKLGALPVSSSPCPGTLVVRMRVCWYSLLIDHATSIVYMHASP